MSEIEEQIEELEEIVEANEEALEEEATAETQEEKELTIAEYAKSKGYDESKGEKTPVQFVEDYTEILKARIKGLEQDVKLQRKSHQNLIKKLEEREKASASSYAEELEKHIKVAADEGNADQVAALLEKYKEANNSLHDTAYLTEDPTDEIDIDAEIQAFNAAHADLFADKDKGVRANIIASELQEEHPDWNIKQVLAQTSKQIRSEYAAPKKIAKTVAPAPQSKKPAKITSNQLTPRHQRTYKMFKDDGIVENVEEFIAFAKEELGDNFKLRGE